jgi:hypothetical protein
MRTKPLEMTGYGELYTTKWVVEQEDSPIKQI